MPTKKFEMVDCVEVLEYRIMFSDILTRHSYVNDLTTLDSCAFEVAFTSA
jgi:hypothetical protein